MEKIKQAFTGKSAEEREAERLTEHGGTGMGTASTQRGATGTEYTGGAAGGPAYGTAVSGRREAPAGPAGAARLLAMPCTDAFQGLGMRLGSCRCQCCPP
jgi:hypothetical protein